MVTTLNLLIYRYDAAQGRAATMQPFKLNNPPSGWMVRDALLEIKAHHDESLTFRHACGEGVCGSDAMNINGKNRLACITPIADLRQPIEIRPLPGVAVIRDLVVDMSGFFDHYQAVSPWLINPQPTDDVERTQPPAQRAQLDGLYECILCGCCTTACPSFWWNPDRFHGPAALLQAWRFLADSRDSATTERLAALDDPYALFRCHSIQNCSAVCPKGLNPSGAIAAIRRLMVRHAL
jgi:succinate dehydrogenase / fumarate reductase, iron-sulfur subunit